MIQEEIAPQSPDEMTEGKSFSVDAFTFDSPQVITDRLQVAEMMECISTGVYYEPPLNPAMVAALLDVAPYHQSPLMFKRNVIMSCFIPHPLLSRQEMSGWVLDYLVFGNCYMEVRRNRLGEVLKLKRAVARYVRRGIKLQDEQYYFVTNYMQDYAFEPGSICQIKNPSVNQEIYGVPEYIAVLHSAMLNGEATLFRRNYYINGSHAGVIVYLNDPLVSQDAVDALKESLKGARRKGAFKNLFVHSPGGKKDGLQILPFSQIAAKDEFAGIKNVTRDDMLAAHRVPPQLMGVMPEGSSSFGDVEKATRVFTINELQPIQESLKELNDWLGIEVIRFKPYALMVNAEPQKKA
ncbi:phage portal protein [Hafnia alvei]|uniref:phage portal protein n=1 Tax=Hafnia alvei TaxID=569 RepID=UPI0018DCEC54|nr:phage portal protein [Hafnia alvei]MBI0277282.1 phage portal protein [Hafnia alvei]